MQVFGVVLGQNGQAVSLFPLVSLFLVFLILYLLVIRPQARRQKQREQMLKTVKKGDRIVTTGGIYGTVVSTRGEDVLVVKIAENVRVDMARPAVATVLGPESAGNGDS
jgi:preprotein translocase subunit YajC